MDDRSVSGAGGLPPGDGDRRPPLDRIRVADFSRVLAGPLATMILGDLGADVVKVERPGSGDETRSWGPPYTADGTAAYYLAVNRNKRSVVIDLGSEPGREQARRLALGADVVVENFRPGTAERLGLGYEDLVVDNPSVVYASITGFGPQAPSTLAGYDFLIQAMSGLMSITGPVDGEPTKTGVAIVDVVTGLYAAIGIVAALHERDRSGRGQKVEVDLMSSALAALVNQASTALNTDAIPRRLGNRHPSIAPYEPFDTATVAIAIAVGNDAQFRTACDVVGCPELADDERFAVNAARVVNRDELHRLLQTALRTQGADEWIVSLRAAGVPCGPLNDVAEAFRFAAAIGIDAVAHTTSGDGATVATVANPIRLSATPIAYRRAPLFSVSTTPQGDPWEETVDDAAG